MKPKTSRTKALLRRDLDDDCYVRPRPYKHPRPLPWYATAECLARPVYAVHEYARISEHLLWRARFNRRLKKDSDLFVRVARFFYAVQEVVGFTAVPGRSNKRKYPPNEAIRARLEPLARELSELLKLTMPKKSVDKSPSTGISLHA